MLLSYRVPSPANAPPRPRWPDRAQLRGRKRRKPRGVGAEGVVAEDGRADGRTARRAGRLGERGARTHAGVAGQAALVASWKSRGRGRRRDGED